MHAAPVTAIEPRFRPGSPPPSLPPESLAEAVALLDLPDGGLDDDPVGLHERFVRYGYVRLPNFLSGEALRLFQEEMAGLERIAVRRGFEMPGYATPRKLSVLGGRVIKEHSPALYGLYHHHALRRSVERIAGRPIYSCRHGEEFMVANFLQTTGDTHGWHLDDPPLALVIFAAAPEAGGGGEAEMVPNWTDLCRRRDRPTDTGIADLVAWAAENDLVERHHHAAGDAYLLRADLNLHRVTPLLGAGTRRWVVNLAFETSRRTAYGDTASLLYGADPQPGGAA